MLTAITASSSSIRYSGWAASEVLHGLYESFPQPLLASSVVAIGLVGAWTLRRRAPVLLELPVDMLAQQYESELPAHGQVRRARPQADAAEIDEIVETLLRARNPVILAGQGVRSSAAKK